MGKNLPKILVTGATGFIGNYLIDRIKDHFTIFALARRFPKNNPLSDHKNIVWIAADIAEHKSLSNAMKIISEQGGLDFVVHLAGYYDFNYDENPEYERTNVRGTKYLLEALKSFEIKRFIFASSVAACNFPPNGERVSEKTEPLAKFAYARSKKVGEELVMEYSKYFNTSVVRFAAVFSDWCEYGPLYVFLKTWLTRNWKSRILGGRGKSAITYVHVNCLIDLLLKIIQQSNQLAPYDVFNVSPENPVSHEELYSLATKYFYGKKKGRLHMPKLVATFGVYFMDLIGKVIGMRPFERPWMMQYIDKQLNVDAGYTREKLGWRPTERYRIQRRLLYMIEHMKSYPYEWQKKNMRMFKAKRLSPNFKIYEMLDILRDQIVDAILEHLLAEKNKNMYSSYHTLDKAQLRKDTITIYQFLSVAVRTKDRVSVLAYAQQIAAVRSSLGFHSSEVVSAIEAIGDIMNKTLAAQESLKGMEQEIYDEITLTFQLMVDEIEGTFEQIRRDRAPILV